MKCIILCAGYATRLYPLTENIPKALLPVKQKPLLNYIIKKLELIENIEEIFIISNDKFYEHFLSWKINFDSPKKIKIINDNTKTNKARLGGLGDLKFVLDKENIHDDLLVIAGDNLFDFDLNKMVDFFNEKKENVVGLYDLKDVSKSKNFGILEIDKDNRIVSYEEKPENPKSTLVSTAIYLYSKSELKKIEDYMKTDMSKEGPGYLIPYFMESQNVYGFVFNGKWYDIGSKETYEEVNREWR